MIKFDGISAAMYGTYVTVMARFDVRNHTFSSEFIFHTCLILMVSET